MGNLCCCFDPDDLQDDSVTSSFHRNPCFCSNCFLHTLFTKYAAVFSKEEEPAVFPAANNVQPDDTAATITTTAMTPPEIMPFDADPNHPNSQQDGLTLPRANASCQTQNKIIPQMTGEGNLVSDNIRSEVASSEHNPSISPIAQIKGKKELDLHYICTSIDDDDVCPTCLVEYSFDNPRIVTECKHHYHLGCIYEWLERSQICPVCRKVMIFDETTWTLTTLNT